MDSGNGLIYESFFPPREPQGPAPAGAANDPGIRTRFLIMSDTYGRRLNLPLAGPALDVVIHCGNLTYNSYASEFVDAIQQLKDIEAPVKIVIGGNRDFSLDLPLFLRKMDEVQAKAGPGADPDAIKRTYGDFGDSMKVVQRNRNDGIFFVHNGTHRFSLPNGARLKIFASPCTPTDDGDGAFTYRGPHSFAIEPKTDLVVTHGPPRGILDLGAGRHVGCPHLFAAVARAQPKMHCFGHVCQGWGAKMVTWQPQISQQPSCDRDIVQGQSWLIEDASTMNPPGSGQAADELLYRERVFPYLTLGRRNTSHCTGDEMPLQRGQTLFVNAAIRNHDRSPAQLPWLVDLELPRRWQDID